MRSFALAAALLALAAAPAGAQCTATSCQTSVTVTQGYGLHLAIPQAYGLDLYQAAPPVVYGGFYAPAPLFGVAPPQYRYKSSVRLQSRGFFRR